MTHSLLLRVLAAVCLVIAVLVAFGEATIRGGVIGWIAAGLLAWVLSTFA